MRIGDGADDVVLGTDTEEGRAKLVAGVPLGRMATPQDIGNAACWLASDEASFITGESTIHSRHSCPIGILIVSCRHRTAR